jgi:hypothetical protein
MYLFLLAGVSVAGKNKTTAVLKTDSGNLVENTKMRKNNIEGTRQINPVTLG